MTAVETKEYFSKFRSKFFRDNQEEAIDFVLTSDKKFTVLEAPTGAGKSLIGMCSMKGIGNGIYAVHSKTLQIQVENDFRESRVLFGRDNYPCLRDPSKTHAHCQSTKLKPCTLSKKCPYKAQKRATLDSDLAVLNYAYLFAELNYVGKFSGRRVVVIDEADSLENSLYQFVSLNISRRVLERYGIKLPDYKTVSTDNGLANWQRWGVETHAELSTELAKLNRLADIYSGEEDDYDLLNQSIERLEALTRKLKIFKTYLDRTWLLETRTDNWGSEVYHFRPLWLNPELSQHFLWSHAEKFVLMSATFPPLEVLSRVLGIPLSDTDQISIPSAFDPDSRRVIVRPVANLTSKTMEAETPKVIREIKKILSVHPNEKGLIHTVSYSLASEIMRIKNPRLITHNSKDKIEVLEHFKQSKNPLVFVSPSSERGSPWMPTSAVSSSWSRPRSCPSGTRPSSSGSIPPR